MEYSKISKFEGIAFVLIVMLNHVILDLPKTFLETCGTSAPINIIFVSILVFAFLYFILKFWDNFYGQDILDIAKFLGGKVLKTIVGIIFLLHFLNIASVMLRNFAEILKLTYFDKAPLYVLLLVLLVPIIIANKSSLKNIFRCNLVITIFMLINLTISFFLLSPRFTFERLFPVFGYGLNETFFSGMSNIFAFSGIAYLYFLMPLLKDYKQFKSIGYISIGLSSIYLLISVICLLISFAGIEFINELSPIYFLIKSAQLGRFFQRPDALFLFSWILSIIAFLCNVVFVISIIFKKITKIENPNAMSYSFGGILFILALLPRNMSIIRFIENVIFKYSSLIVIFTIGFLILFLANLKYKRLSKKQKGDLIKDET